MFTQYFYTHMSKILDLQSLRRDYDKKQYEIAQILNLPQSSISAIENYKTAISPRNIKILVDELHVTNIDKYMIEKPQQYNIANNSGDGNGVANYVQKGAEASAGKEVAARLDALDKSIVDIAKNTGDRYDALQKANSDLNDEIKELHNKLMRLALRCAKKGVDYEDIIDV